MHEYQAEIVRVIDGDTVRLDIDLGFRLQLRETFRLSNVNCAELGTDLGQQAKDFAIDWFAINDGKCMIRSDKPLSSDKYGRWLAKIYGGETCLNELLLQNSLAVPYMVKI